MNLTKEEFENAIKTLYSAIDWDKLKLEEEKAFQELKKSYPQFINQCNLLETNND